MSKTRVRGLLDIVCLADGEEWELEPPSEGFVHGMGLGATEEARRWAYKGFLLETGPAIQSVASKKGGRPQLARYQHIDCRRAYAIWQYVNRHVAQNRRKNITNRELINHVQQMELDYVKLTSSKKPLLFPSTTVNLETSLSRGRKILKIDRTWRSKVCEKLSLTYSQTTD